MRSDIGGVGAIAPFAPHIHDLSPPTYPDPIAEQRAEQNSVRLRQEYLGLKQEIKNGISTGQFGPGVINNPSSGSDGGGSQWRDPWQKPKTFGGLIPAVPSNVVPNINSPATAAVSSIPAHLPIASHSDNLVFNPVTGRYVLVPVAPVAPPRPQPAATPAPPPTVVTASGMKAQVGQRFTNSQGQTIVVNSNGSMTNQTTGQTTGNGTHSYNPSTNSWGTVGQNGQWQSDADRIESAYQERADNRAREARESRGKPVLIDLDNNGLAVDTLSSSSQFVDLAGDGFLHRTAWAGAGDGVLVIDTDGNGQISRSNEFVFTEWDSSATGDLEAIRNVFDTNHNGLLDAGDARWGEFKVMVNGALQTLASLGIASIDLRAKGGGQQFVDGSSINGTTTFTRTDGTTGIVGDATLVSDANGYRIERSQTVSGDGVITETILAYDRAGTLAFRNLVVTSADGVTRLTRFDDDGNGTFDRSQSDGTVVASDGTRTRTIANLAADGSLVNKTITLTSADGRSITTTIDQDGNGLADQSNVLTTAADGSSTSLTKAFGRDGTLSKQVKVEASADGLSKTTSTDADGDGVFESVVQETSAINADGSRTRVESRRSTDGTLLGQTESLTSADNRSKTVKLDHSGTGVYDETQTTTIAVDATGAASTTVTSRNADGSLHGQVVSTVSADGLVRSEAQDLTGDGVADRLATRTTTTDANGNRVQTETLKSASGALLARTVTTTSGDGKTIVISEDRNGDGYVDQETMTLVGGGVGVPATLVDVGTTARASMQYVRGQLVARSESKTSADGLSSSTSIEANGDGVIDQTETMATITNADGSQTRTVTSTAGNGAVIGSTVTTISADSLSQTIASDGNGDGLADRIEAQTIVLNADGSRIETVESKAGNGSVLARTVTTTSADRQTMTRTVDDNGDGKVELTEVQTRLADGGQTLVATRSNAAGTMLGRTTTTTSRDGLTKTIEQDVNGDGVIDSKSVSITVLNADGSKTVTTTVSNGANVVGRSIVTSSGNGLVVTSQSDADGNGTVDGVVTETTVINTDGSRTTTALKTVGSTVVSKTLTTVSANGLVVTSAIDADNSGSTERVVTTTKVLNADGSIVETAEARSATNALLARTVTTSSADGKTITTSEDGNGDGAVDTSTTTVIGADGVTTKTQSQFGANGSLIARVISQSSANGLSTTRTIDVNGDGVVDRTETETIVLNADGSKTTTVTVKAGNGAAIGSTTTTISANGLSQTVTRDINGDGVADNSSLGTSVRNADGSTTQVITDKAGNGTVLAKTTTTTSGDGRTVTRTSDDNNDGKVDLCEVEVRHADGSQSTTTTRTNAAGSVQSNVTSTISADGLTTTVSEDANVDAKSVSTTVLNADGSRKVTTTISSGTSVVNRTIVITSANGLSTTTESDVDADGDIDSKVVETTTLDASGSRTVTTTKTLGNTLVGQTVTTVGANGLSTTTSLDADGNGTVERIANTTRQLDADGSTTETAETRTAGSVLLAKTVTTTSGNGNTTATTEDVNGDGVVDQRIETILNADGSRTVMRRQLGAAGALLSQSVTEVSANGLTQTIRRDGDGNATFETVISDVTVINANGSKTQTISETKADGSLVSRQIVTTSANGLSRTTTWTGAAGAALGSETVTKLLHADGSSLETLQRFKPDGVTLERKTTTLTGGDGRSVVTQIDLNGDGKTDQRIETVRQADGQVVQTLTDLASDGVTVRARKTVTTSANGLVETAQYDADGTPEKRTVRTIVLNADGSTTETTENYRPPGATALLSRIVTETSANGLVRNWSATGAAGAPLSKDTRRDVTVFNADGSTTRTITIGNETAAGITTQEILSQTTSANGLSITTRRADIGQEQTDVTVLNANGTKTRTVTSSVIGGSQISKTTTTTSADSLTITTLEERSGQPNRTLTSTRVVRADGFVVDTLTTKSAAGVLLDKIVTSTSPDQRSITITRDANGDGVMDQLEERSVAVDGSATTKITSYKAGGAIDNVTIAKTSADGLTTTTERDRNGDGAVEHKRVSVTTQDAFGRQVTVTTDTDETGTVIAKTTTTTSAEGNTRITVKDLDGKNGTTDQTETISADGGRYITTVQLNDAEGQALTNLAAGVVQWKKAIARKVETKTTVDGTETIVSSDYTGDAGLEHVVVSKTQIDGSIVSTMTEKNAAGAIIARGTMRQSADGRVTTLELDSDNNGTIDRSETTTTGIDGSVTLVAIDRNPDGTFKQTTTETISASGRLLNSITKDGADKRIAETVVTALGSSTTTTYDGASQQKLSEATSNAKGLLTEVKFYDSLNANAWSRVEQAFDSAEKKISETQYMDDGTRVTISFDPVSGNQKFVRSYNASNVLTSDVIFDTANASTWSRSERYYDSAGRETSSNLVYDNGTRSVKIYDLANVNAWTRVEQSFDSTDKKINETQYMDNGTRVAISFDPASGNQKFVQSYNASNVLTSDVIFDTANASTWSRSERYYDSAGRETSSNLVYDNGTRSVKIYDLANVNAWTRVEQSFDSTDKKINETQYMDNGTRVAISFDPASGNQKFVQNYNASNVLTSTVTYDFANASTWSRFERYYDSAGRETSSNLVNDNGTRSVKIYDPANANPWSRIEQTFNAAGKQNGETQYFDNGTRAEIAFDANGKPTSVSYYNASNVFTGSNPIPPVLLDLNGDGQLDLVPLNRNGFGNVTPSFDWDGDGTRDRTAWVGPADGFLAIDLAADGSAGGDGLIDQASELAFSTWGDPALEPDGVVSDLDGLRLVFDTNHDNVLDSNDARWNEFRVWQDTNQNGITDAGELRTMSQAGINLINLVPSATGSRSLADGSAITGTSTAQRADGTSLLVGDASLAHRQQGAGF